MGLMGGRPAPIDSARGRTVPGSPVCVQSSLVKIVPEPGVEDSLGGGGRGLEGQEGSGDV